MKHMILLSFLAVLSACQTTPRNESNSAVSNNPKVNRPNIYKQGRPSGAAEIETLSIDYAGLQSFLKLNRSFDVLGYSERMFNTCEVGYGYSSTHNCEKKYFIVSHFNLQCRDSEGTISQILTAADLRPIARRQVNWTLKSASGTLYTDSEGYGQIAMVSSQSQRNERLKLAIENDFLYLKAGDLKRMITPKNWCNQ